MATPENPQIQQFMAGGGEMGAMIRAYDWSKTPVGPPETWPQSLRTTLSIMLETHFPMYIAWGKEFIQFYNDGYRPILGDTKHPAIGKSTKETFAEIWDIIGPMFEGVMQGNAVGVNDFLLPMSRFGYIEECYFIFSYSPVRDESGGVGGVLVTVTETSNRVIEERRLKTLRDMANRASEVKTFGDAWESIRQTIDENPYDIPYALGYDINESSEKAVLAVNVRLVGNPSVKTDIDLNNPNKSLVLPGIFKDKRPVLVATASIETKEVIAGAWPEPITNAYIVPLSRHDKSRPFGSLALGVNPRKAFDDSYAVFFNLFAGHAATAINNAMAFETERKRAEALQEIDKAKTAFFSNISHEFRTPLTLMLGPLEEMLQEPVNEVSDKAKENIKTSHRNALRLLRLVNTLLDFSRIESGRVEASFRPVDLSAYTANLASNFRSIVEKAGLEYEINCHEIPGGVYVDKGMWEKIVLNLLSNAFKYTLTGRISVTLDHDKGNAVLKVSDTGVGIPENELPHMFERFHRVKNVVGRTYEGTGIGLSLVDELLKLHKGTITVESTMGQGSTFTVQIPIGTAHLPASQVEYRDIDDEFIAPGEYLEEAESLLEKETNVDGAGDESPGDENGKKPTVLVVDDNADMRAHIMALLNKNYVTSAAKDGAEALEKMKTVKPDLVLSDIMMPGIDGIQLLKTIKETKQFMTIPVILLSARAGEEARMEGYEVGADDYLVKPFAAKELLARVRAQIKISNTRAHIEKQLITLFEQAPVSICILRGPDFVIEVANEGMLELWGKKAKDIMNKPLFEAMPDAAGQGFEAILENVYKTGERFVGYELPIDLVRQGKPESIYVKFVYEALREEDGSISGIMAMADDITAQVNVRKKIEESEERMRMAVQSTRLGTWEFSPITGELNWSEECKEIYGLPPGVVVDFDIFSKHIYPADMDIALKAIEKAMDPTGDGNYDISYRILRFDDGSTRWIRAQGKVFFNAEQTAERFIGTVIDINDQKQFEQTLRASEQRTRLAIEAADLGTFDWNLEKGQFFSSQRLIDIFGFKGRTDVAHEDLLKSFHPDDKPTRDSAVAESYEKGSLVYEARVIWPDNTIHWVRVHGKVLYDPDKKPQRMYGTVIDVTGEKQRSDELEKKVEERTRELKETITELARSNNDLEQFAYVASHDLNEPIRIVSTYTSLFAKKYADNLPEGATVYMDYIMEGTSRMRQLIKDLLQYARTGNAKLPFSKIDCNKVLNVVIHNLTDVIKETGATVTSEKLPVVNGIETQLGQLFQNLVENGIKFRGKNPVIIKISVAPSHSDWRFCVEDNGIGIDQSYFDRIFVIFQRLHARGEYEGTGIGLSVCKKIAEMHGGRIWLESEPGKGTKFFFTIPK